MLEEYTQVSSLTGRRLGRFLEHLPQIKIWRAAAGPAYCTSVPHSPVWWLKNSGGGYNQIEMDTLAHETWPGGSHLLCTVLLLLCTDYSCHTDKDNFGGFTTSVPDGYLFRGCHCEHDRNSTSTDLLCLSWQMEHLQMSDVMATCGSFGTASRCSACMRRIDQPFRSRLAKVGMPCLVLSLD